MIAQHGLFSQLSADTKYSALEPVGRCRSDSYCLQSKKQVEWNQKPLQSFTQKAAGAYLEFSASFE